MKSRELFAGAGGLTLGITQAGFNHELVMEINPDACQTLHLNQSREWAARLTNYDPLDRDAIAQRVEKLCQDMSQKLGCFEI